MTRTALSLAALAILTACAAAPVSYPELPGISATDFACSQLDPAEAKRRLQQAWTQCYAGPDRPTVAMAGNVPIIVPPATNAGTRVLSDGPADGGSLEVRLSGGTQVLQARFFTTKSCRTVVAADGKAGLWVTAARNTGHWLENPGAPGPVANCR